MFPVPCRIFHSLLMTNVINGLAILLCLTLFFITVIQLPVMANFLAVLRQAIAKLTRSTPTYGTEGRLEGGLGLLSRPSSLFLPKATVILCLRGADPSLTYCLEGLLSQDYPDYNIQVVIDSESDPAWHIVQPFLAKFGERMQANLLKTKHVTCGLKCSALLQAIDKLQPDCEVVALLDADTVPHATWLRELITPLENWQVGATTGNRWYAPDGQCWGSIARYVHNISAIVGMHYYEVAWAGSLAIRTERLCHPKFLECLAHSLVEDAPLCQFLQAQNLRVQFVPTLLMTNREECTLPQFMLWLTRQLVNARLYYGNWKLILGMGFVTAIAPVIAMILLPILLWTGQQTAAIWLSIGLLALAFLGTLLPMLLVEQQVNQLLASRGEPIPDFSWRLCLKKYLIVVPLNYLICSKVVMDAFTTKTIEWRGIIYKIEDSCQVRLTHYTPYQGQTALEHSNVSL
jgi:cellulose synthase/poly-beta-1,6-N-acetylglucosamine synthase-like glycosyltransferase